MVSVKETASTIQYYNDNAESFKKETITANMHEMQDWFLSFVKEKGTILDLGCGTGRDTKYFLEKGYQLTAVDGSLEMCRIAGENTGLVVRRLLFEELDYDGAFDAVWACASLLHVSYEDLPEILSKIWTALNPGGILYSSFKTGTFQGKRNGRFYTDLTEEVLSRLLEESGLFSVLDSRESFDVRPGRNNEVWINVIAKRI